MTEAQKQIAIPLTVAFSVLLVIAGVTVAYGAERQVIYETSRTAQKNSEDIQEIKEETSTFKALILRLEKAVDKLENKDERFRTSHP